MVDYVIDLTEFEIKNDVKPSLERQTFSQMVGELTTDFTGS